MHPIPAPSPLTYILSLLLLHHYQGFISGGRKQASKQRGWKKEGILDVLSCIQTHVCFPLPRCVVFFFLRFLTGFSYYLISFILGNCALSSLNWSEWEGCSRDEGLLSYIQRCVGYSDSCCCPEEVVVLIVVKLYSLVGERSKYMSFRAKLKENMG
ncbi:hypothetical protein HOY80DRAFT_169745 [Tuber brumale]|nr:hypothetical protein HOY80DRAFT_169745 [Tuber brumale]